MKKTKELKFIESLIPNLFDIVNQGFESSSTEKRYKKDQGLKSKSLITEIDIKIDRYITKAIKNHFPNDNILSEESASVKDTLKVDRSKTRLWVIDPICGTGNFASGIKFFSTNIALFEAGKAVFALVSDYSKQTYYWAEKNTDGVYQEDKKTSHLFKLDSAYELNVDPGFIMGKSKKEIEAYKNIVSEVISNKYHLLSMGSSLSFTYAALAKIGAFIVFQVYPWDFVSSCYLIEKNGGVATDFSGRPWSLASKNIVASLDNNIHRSLLEIVQAYWVF